MMSGGQIGFKEELDGRIWTAPDEMASEVETGEFIYGLIRVLKPRVCVETGCYRGDTSLYIAKALHDNRVGRLFTCDTDAEMVSISQNRLLPLGNTYVLRIKGVEMAEHIKSFVDFAFLDSSGDRLEEAEAFQFSTGAIVVLHDARRPAFEHIKTLGWQHLFIPTPRGLAIFQTP